MANCITMSDAANISLSLSLSLSLSECLRFFLDLFVAVCMAQWWCYWAPIQEAMETF